MTKATGSAKPTLLWTRTNRARRGDPKALARLLESAKAQSADWNMAMEVSPRPKPDLTKANLAKQDLRGFNLNYARLAHASLEGAKLSETQLYEAILHSASLDGADLEAADLTQSRATAATFVGARLRGSQLREGRFDETDFSSADLREANLSNGLFGWADFSAAKLDGSFAVRTDFTSAVLSGASLKGAVLREANFSEADLTGADLRKADLQGANVTGADLRGANLRGADVSGANVWGVRYDVTDIEQGRQHGMLVHDRVLFQEWLEHGHKEPEWGPVRVHNIEVAHFMSLVMRNPMLATILDATTSSVVLLLGRFSGPSAGVLERLKGALPGLGYAPIVFNFDGPRSRDTIEVISTLAGLSRFIIADLTDPRSVPLESHAIVPHLSVPFVPIIQSSEDSFSMFDDLGNKYYWVHQPVRYADADDLFERLETEVIAPAERTLRTISKKQRRPNRNRR